MTKKRGDPEGSPSTSDVGDVALNGRVSNPKVLGDGLHSTVSDRCAAKGAAGLGDGDAFSIRGADTSPRYVYRDSHSSCANCV